MEISGMAITQMAQRLSSHIRFRHPSCGDSTSTSWSSVCDWHRLGRHRCLTTRSSLCFQRMVTTQVYQTAWMVAGQRWYSHMGSSWTSAMDGVILESFRLFGFGHIHSPLSTINQFTSGTQLTSQSHLIGFVFVGLRDMNHFNHHASLAVGIFTWTPWFFVWSSLGFWIEVVSQFTSRTMRLDPLTQFQYSLIKIFHAQLVKMVLVLDLKDLTG